jgi:hypothetical protein
MNPPLSVRAAVRTRRSFMDRFEREVAGLNDPAQLYLTDDFNEAVRAHLEKRPPRPFKGSWLATVDEDISLSIRKRGAEPSAISPGYDRV